MNENWNPEIPLNLQQNLKREKEQAFTLYLDFVVDATASMYTVFPAVYYAAAHFLECLSKYEVYPQIGLTLIRNEDNGEETETILFEGRESFTSDISLFLKKRTRSTAAAKTAGSAAPVVMSPLAFPPSVLHRVPPGRKNMRTQDYKNFRLHFAASRI